ncbi:hypothetical protein FQV26_09690 [Planococcus sp. CPCC 101016]|uniref:hypothetical protein n=1 Tax=Planococcus sp. CPCC 101016 TaxID=2599617 RepID=UPI0011B595D3|nr:hypothetical protein [Planococcus sp. CPCC 101016]TWT08060.1 hypothetical protein FQV26_09690 [Planococcus sp. CPCC 101016]
MKYKLHFTIPIFTEDLDTFPIPENENYDYWVPLLSYFIEQSNIIEIHCWNDEKDVIKETTLLFKDSFKIVNGRDITVIKASNTDYLSNYLLYENIKTNGKLKWFSIFLSKNETPLLHSEHWGTEFFAPNLREEDIVYIKSVTPADTDFHQWS